MPHAEFVAQCGISNFDSAMLANYELTKRFTAEFSIRPFLLKYREQSLTLLAQWVKDSSPQVRRLVSEGTRPRLPWAMRLPEFQADPQLTLPLLELLKDDPELYVRRSVANHLGDLAKDHPDVVFDVCETWLKQLKGADDKVLAENRKWLIRHAVRHPAKQEVRRAIQIRTLAAKQK